MSQNLINEKKNLQDLLLNQIVSADTSKPKSKPQGAEKTRRNEVLWCIFCCSINRVLDFQIITMATHDTGNLPANFGLLAHFYAEPRGTHGIGNDTDRPWVELS